MSLTPSDLAPGLVLGSGVEMGAKVVLGANIVIHNGAVIEEGCVLQDGVVIGKEPKLSARSTARHETEHERPRLEPGVVVGAGAVVFAAVRIGQNTIVGDQTYVRERARIGKETVIGRGTAVDNDVQVGDRVSVQSNCYITAFTVIEDDVFVGPGVVTTNDHTMGRHAPDASLDGPTLRRACRIGGGAVLAPGIEIGEEAFVAAGAVVVKDVPSKEVVMGVPARQVRRVPESDLLEQWR